MVICYNQFVSPKYNPIYLGLTLNMLNILVTWPSTIQSASSRTQSTRKRSAQKSPRSRPTSWGFSGSRPAGPIGPGRLWWLWGDLGLVKLTFNNKTPRNRYIYINMYMDVSENRGTPQIIHFNRVFHYKPSILGYHYFWKHLYIIYIYIIYSR